MKANEAPERIYIDDPTGEFDDRWSIYKNDDGIEYIRTDVFVEKACEFMRNNIDKQLTIYHNNAWKKRDEFIEDFVNYMKG